MSARRIVPYAVRAGAAVAFVTALSGALSAQQVRVERIEAVTRALVGPEMEGRATGTAGAERAARYLAAQFASLGLRPVGDSGTFFQSVALMRDRILPTSEVRIGDVVLKYPVDFVATPPLASEVDVSGPLVLGGFGRFATAPEELARFELKGAVVLLFQGRPTDADSATWVKIPDLARVRALLFDRGVAAVLSVDAGAQPRKWSALVADALEPRLHLPAAPSTRVALQVSPDAAERLFRTCDLSLAETIAEAMHGSPALRRIGGARVALHVAHDEVRSSNVAAMIPGRDSALASEVVLVSAHYDGLGRTRDGVVRAGAADNAVGVATIAAVAEAIAHDAPPRRSILFVAFTGEELGLLGSRHYAGHPLWPLERTAANINVDGVGTEMLGPVTALVAYGAEYSTLSEPVAAAAAATRVALIPDPFPAERPFTRSDQFVFASVGVPALMLLGAPDTNVAAWERRAREWMATSYHQAGDTIRRDWDWEGPRRLGEVVSRIVVNIANADMTPRWNATSPFQRSGRKSARGVTRARPSSIDVMPTSDDWRDSDRYRNANTLRQHDVRSRAPVGISLAFGRR